MPVYLLHGFKWPREFIRIHIILQNLDDAAAEWLVAPATTSTLLANFKEIYPECMEHLSGLRFVEQYDPEDTTSTASQPYAYVADVCVEIKLGIDVDEIRGRGVPNDQWAAIMELRDKLAQDQKVAWYVVICGDEDRWAPGLSASSESLEHEGSTGASQNGDESSEYAPSLVGGDDAAPEIRPSTQEEQQPRGLKKLFSSISMRKSRSNLEATKSVETMQPAVQDMSIADANKRPGSLKTRSSDSSGPKAGKPMTDEPFQRNILQEQAPPPTLISRLQTHDLSAQPSYQMIAGAMVQSPGGLSLIPDDEDHEIITGPQSDDDDDLAAPAPIVKHGKQQDLVSRQRKRSSIASFTSARKNTSSTALQHISPAVRSQPTSLSSSSFSPTDSQPYPSNQLHSAIPYNIEEEPVRMQKPANISPPASYVPTGAPASIRTSRSASPVKPAPRREDSGSRLAALSALEGIAPRAESPPRRSNRGVKNRRSSNLNARNSQYSLSSMSGTMAQLYAARDRDFKNRQSVTQEELVARGLESMDFTALR